MSYTFQKPTRPVNRIFLHCSASDRPEHDSAAVIDAWHKEKGWSGIGYHLFIRKDGVVERGRDLELTPAAQSGHNSGTIAICLHGLAVDKFTAEQFQALRGLCAQIDEAYAGRVTFHGHCEVAAKACPVFDYRGVLELDGHGHLSARAAQHAPDAVRVPRVEPGDLEVLEVRGQVLQLGSRGDDVAALQTLLTSLGYHVGTVDGEFGKRTRAAVLAFQADNHLVTDGKVGAITRELLGSARPREIAEARANMTIAKLAAGGSRITALSVGNSLLGAGVGVGGLVSLIDDLVAATKEVSAQADQIQGVFDQHGIAAGALLLAAGAAIAWRSWRAAQARLEDHRTGKTA